MRPPPALLNTRLEQFRARWEVAHSAAHEAARDTETDLAALTQRLHSRLAETDRSAGGLLSAHDLHDRVHGMCAWADTAAARLPRVRSGLTRREKRLGRFSVVLFGRTQAGKSTIREALMGGDGGTIGNGAQRATRNAREYDWGDCVVVDTPGIGAYEAADDREQALEAAESADIVVFVISSDGLQEDTFDGLAALRRRNMPVIFALNVRRNLAKPVFRDKFLADPAFVFKPEELSGHVARIRRLASDRLGLDEVAIYPVHAQAAHIGVTCEDGDTGHRLREASRLDELTAALAHEVAEKAVIRRLQTTTDAVVCPLDEQRLQATEHMRHLQCEREALELLEREAVSRTSACWDDGRTRALNAVEVLANKLRSEIGEFIEKHADDGDIAERWHSLMERYSRRLQAQVQRVAEDTLGEVRAEIESLMEEMAATDGVAAGAHVDADLQRCRMGWEEAGRWLSRAAPLVVVRLPLPPHIKFVLTVATALISMLLEALLRWTRRKRVEILRAALQESLESWESQAKEQTQDWFTRADADLRRPLRALVSARVAALAQLEGDLRDLADSISARVRELNRDLIVSVAELLGAPDPEAVSHVARQPGRCTWVVWRGLQDESFLGAIGGVLGEQVCRAPGRTRAQHVAALLRQAGVDTCRVSIVNGKGARVVLGGGLQPDGVPQGIVMFAEDLTGLRVTITRGE